MKKDAKDEDVVGFLGEIDSRLAAEAAKGRVLLYIFGGAAAVIGYGSPRSTLDIDGYLEDKKVEKKILEWAAKGSELEKKYGLYFQPANTELMLIEAPEWKERSVEILAGTFNHLKVLALGKEDLILSKLSRFSDRDREDIRFLIETQKVKARTLISYFRSARDHYAGNLRTLDGTFNFVLKEFFGREPIEP